MKIILSILGIIFLGLIVLQGFRIYSYGKVSKRLVSMAKPFSYKASHKTGSILIVGDSLGIGVGSNREDSLSGRLHRDFPDYDIDNISQSGIKIKDGLSKIKNLEKEKKYNFIIIQLGANDITRFTKITSVVSDLRELLKIAHEHSNKVIFVTSGSVGYAPLFIEPFSSFYTNRSKTFFKDYKKIAEESNTKYVNLFFSKEEDPFRKDEDKFYAEDKFHPSGAGYGLWYENIKKVINK